MPVFDLPYQQLQTYKPPRNEPADFEAFWQQTLEESHLHDLKPQFEPVDFGLKTLETFDLTFSGYAGQPIKGWFTLPKHRQEPLPCVVEYIGYGGGRGWPIERLVFASAGYAHLLMDTRGQGSRWSRGDTPDIAPDGDNPQHPGFMTRGILNPKTYYYRRVFTDAVRAVEAARSHAAVDPAKVAVTGGSQGGGISLAVAGLLPGITALMADVPFLCHYRRATELVDTAPYNEISTFCKVHRDKVEQVFNTLRYFDGVNFAARAKARALFSVGLMDDICPPSTVYAAYNHYAGPKEIKVYPYNNHEGGESYQILEKLRFLQQL